MFARMDVRVGIIAYIFKTPMHDGPCDGKTLSIVNLYQADFSDLRSHLLEKFDEPLLGLDVLVSLHDSKKLFACGTHVVSQAPDCGAQMIEKFINLDLRYLTHMSS